jgi:hypothetical protein
MELRRPVCRAAPKLPNWGVGFLAREAQQQAGEARQREAEQVVGDGRDAVHGFTIATAAGPGN